MENVLSKAIQEVRSSDISICKFITANDVGATGGHQSGFHIPKNAWRLFFESPGRKGENSDVFVTINWQGEFETTSRFIYYGIGTRNEYRLTRFGRGFPYLNDENIGDLLVICRKSEDFYKAFVLNTDDDIEGFCNAVNISVIEANGIIPSQFETTAETKMLYCLQDLVEKYGNQFPPTNVLSDQSRNCFNVAYNITSRQLSDNPDLLLIQWLDSEFQLFKLLESKLYEERISKPFNNIQELIDIANTILNRRKSRAGKSLEHHLEAMFSGLGIHFESQVTTEDYKKPDFIFPGQEAYHNRNFNSSKLLMLGAKTTCKDRWRQILNEADRIKTKHLFTLQQGISGNQLAEMKKSNVVLVVPKDYHKNFPKEYRGNILSLKDFLQIVESFQN